MNQAQERSGNIPGNDITGVGEAEGRCEAASEDCTKLRSLVHSVQEELEKLKGMAKRRRKKLNELHKEWQGYLPKMELPSQRDPHDINDIDFENLTK
eukprot:847217-Prorocentrum_minimum.AAC.1